MRPRLRQIDGEIIKDTFDYLLTKIKQSVPEGPVILIKGQGGVGKTTLCENLSVQMSDTGSDLVVLSAPDIIVQLAKTPELGADFTLFNLLRAIYNPRELGLLGEREFAWAFDMGRVSFVIDGIDEIIPRLGSSTAIDTFFHSVVQYSNHLRRGKLVLTCRYDSFIVPSDMKADKYELLPFDESQIKEYLEIRFPSSKTAIIRAVKFLDELSAPFETGASSGRASVWPDGILPFVLRVVCDSVEDDKDVRPSAHIERSDILDMNISQKKMDYVVYKICEREDAKYEYSRMLGNQNPVDVQCEFFINLAIHYHDRCDRLRVGQYFKSVSPGFDDASILPFFNHPLLRRETVCEGTSFSVSFSDDVVREFFLALGFARVLDGKARFTISQLSDIVDLSQFRSPFMMEVAGRLPSLTDDIMIRIADLIGQARNEFLDRDRLEEYYRHASALFNAGLQISRRPHIESCTDYLKQLFGSGAEPLDAVALRNIPIAARIRFDFSGLVFTRASVLDFEDFCRCAFSEKTEFRSSQIRTGMGKPTKTDAQLTNFVGCDLDYMFLRSMSLRSGKSLRRIEDATQYLRDFMLCFRKYRSYKHSQIIHDLNIAFSGNDRLTLEDILKACETSGIVEINGDEIKIAPAELENVEAFMLERIYRTAIQTAIFKIFEQIK